MIYYEFYFLYFKIIYYTSYSNAVITDNLTFLYANPRTLLFPLVNKKSIWDMGLLGKNTNKTSFFFVKRQKNNQKVVLFIVFVYFCTRKIRCRIIFMNTTIDNRTLTQTSVNEQRVNMEQEVKDWEKYSRQIVLAMSKRMAELGMTQQMLAEKMNCTQQYVSKVLKGQKNMSLETLCKIESTLGIEIFKRLDDIE